MLLFFLPFDHKEYEVLLQKGQLRQQPNQIRASAALHIEILREYIFNEIAEHIERLHLRRKAQQECRYTTHPLTIPQLTVFAGDGTQNIAHRPPRAFGAAVRLDAIEQVSHAEIEDRQVGAAEGDVLLDRLVGLLVVLLIVVEVPQEVVVVVVLALAEGKQSSTFWPSTPC